jgi:hypothetical protein
MPQCPSLSKCPFFNDKMANMPAAADMIKTRYCLTDHATCARWMVRMALSPEKVPGNLYPKDVERAKAMIGSAGS